MRAIVDTNVWLDWLVFDDARLAPLAEAIASGAVRVEATAPMLEEFASVLRRPHFGLDEAARHAACARQRVDWLLSRDKALLRLRRVAGRRFGLRIGTPEDWRAALGHARL